MAIPQVLNLPLPENCKLTIKEFAPQDSRLGRVTHKQTNLNPTVSASVTPVACALG